jgi:hypothetical protein
MGASLVNGGETSENVFGVAAPPFGSVASVHRPEAGGRKSPALGILGAVPQIE